MGRRTRQDRWPRKATRLALALMPALIASALVAASLAIRVTTPVALQMTTASVTFTVGTDDGDAPGSLPLLNNSTAFSAITLEGCDSIALPALRIGATGGTLAPTPGNVTFRCSRHSAARVAIRSDDARQMGLGNVDRVTVQPGDTVRFDLANTDPLAVRLQMAGNAPLGFSLRQDVPFAIDTEHVEAEGFDAPATETGSRSYDALLPGDSSSRRVTTTALNMLSAVIELANAERAATLFADNIDIPLSGVSIFRQDPGTRTFESRVADGRLTFPALGTPDVPLRKGNRFAFGTSGGIRLTSLGVDTAKGGIALTVEGDAEELRVNGVDQRVRLFDRLVSDRNRSIAAIVALVASQFLWLRKAMAS